MKNNIDGHFYKVPFIKKKELESMKKQFDVYKGKMEALLISQLDLLKEINRDEE